MTKEELINYLKSNCWNRKYNDSDWEYERSYANCIYDWLYIYDDDKVSLSYNDIGWGYTNINNYEFTYEEFVGWWDCNMN